MSSNTDWGYFGVARNIERRANILLLPVNLSEIWIVKPQNFLVKPFVNCYSTDIYTFERLFNLVVLSGFCEFSTVYGDFIVKKFLQFWQPKMAIFIESEIWPNILWQAHRRNIPITLLNARLSETSLRNWLCIKKISRKLWGCFSAIYTQSDIFTQRFHKLGASCAKTLGNIKLLSEKLPFDDSQYLHWKKQISGRPCWVAASTHKGEEDIIFKIHKVLKKDIPDLLTIIVPRHVERCDAVVQKREDLTVARFTDQHLHDQDILLVDAMAKLGIFYRLSSIAFIGGSLVPVGGHNPLEPAMIGAFPLWGPHFFNVNDMIYLFEEMPCQQIDMNQLTGALKDLLSHPQKVTALVESLQQRIVSSQQLVNQKIDDIVNSI